MFFVIDKSKIFSYMVAICTVVILFVAAAGISDIATDNSLMTSTNIVDENEVEDVNSLESMNIINTVDNQTI